MTSSTRCIRYSVLVALIGFCISLVLWPAQKNLGTLMSCSAAVMIATQFWHPRGGGLYMAWYLPLVLLTIFRPNLEDRVALSRAGRRLVSQAATRNLAARAGSKRRDGAVRKLRRAQPQVDDAASGNRFEAQVARLGQTSGLSVPGLNQTSSHPLAAISSSTARANGGGR